MEDGLCSLIIDHAKCSDAGKFTCHAENGFGKANSSAVVIVDGEEDPQIVKPHFIEPLIDVSALEGQEIILECQVVGKPIPQLAWYKDGIKLFIENRMLSYTDRKGVVRLNIMRATVKDAGEYSCEAQSKAGRDYTHCNVKITEIDSARAARLGSPLSVRSSPSRASPSEVSVSKPPSITRPLENVTIMERRKTAMSCDITGVPTPEIEWFKDGKLLAESRYLRVYFDGRTATVKIYEAHLSHEGEYTCRLVSPHGTAETKAQLFVEELSTAGAMPKFVKKTEDIFVHSGDNATMTCLVYGKPKPEVQWQFNGRILVRDSEPYRMRDWEDGTHTLEIADVSNALCGIYTCKALNASGTAHCSSTLGIATVSGEHTVGGTVPGFVTLPPGSLSVEEGQLLDITCDIKGEPKPRVMFMKGEREFQATGNRTKLLTEGSRHTFMRQPVRQRDEGDYQVILQNPFGRCVASVSVTVIPSTKPQEPSPAPEAPPKLPQNVPGPPTGEPRVFDIGKSSVKLAWGKPLIDGGSGIEQYKIEFRTPDSAVWVERGFTEVTTFEVSSLKEDTEYLFRVFARNKVDYGPPSETSHAIRTLSDSQKPTITKKLEAKTSVSEGEKITLHVTSQGTPAPSVKWMKDGAEVVESKRITVDSQQPGQSFLKINTAELTDEGVFMCHVENEAGHVSTQTNVEVKTLHKEEPTEETPVAKHGARAPEILLALSDVTARAGQIVKLTARIDAMPKGRICWYKDGQAIKPEGRFEILASQHLANRLVIHDAAVDDTGIYTVVCQNKSGTAQSQCQVNVLAHLDYRAPVFIKEVQDQCVDEGAEVILQAKVDGEPDPQIVWLKDGEKLKTTRRMQLTFTQDDWCFLTIFSCTMSDTGTYVCCASNSAGSDACQALLTIKSTGLKAKETTAAEAGKPSDAPTDEKNPPRFVQTPPNNVTTLEGKDVALTCQVKSCPPAVLKWYKDGHSIQTGPKVQVTTETPETSTLLISGLKVDDTAKYTCQAINEVGKRQTSCYVEVKAEAECSDDELAQLKASVDESPPTVIRHVADCHAIPGTSASLKCCIGGNPTPTVRWEHNGNPMEYSEDHQILRNGDWAEMLFHKVRVDDLGEYHCIAENKHGRAMSSGFLSIGGEEANPCQPHFIRCLCNVSAHLGQTVSLIGQVYGNPEPDISWYHNGIPVSESKNVEISFSSDLTCILTIHKVTKETLGQYVCRASNLHGTVESAGKVHLGHPKRGQPPAFLTGLEDVTIVIHGTPGMGIGQLVRGRRDGDIIEPPTSADLTEEELLSGKVSTTHTASHAAESITMVAEGELGGDSSMVHESMRESIEIQRREEKVEIQKKKVTHLETGTEHKRRGLAPSFVRGLEDMDLHVGESLELAGKTKHMKRRHRHRAEVTEKPRAADAESKSKTVDEIRNIISTRNERTCVPKFIVRPRSKKLIEEGKSLRLKTAISGNPQAVVTWDKNGTLLETGSKYSIYNDGDFYYLEIHHVTDSDSAFYNCTAVNDEGMAITTSEVSVMPREGSKKPAREPTFIEVLPGKLEVRTGEAVTVECSVAAYPSPAVTWYCDKRPIIPGPEVQMSYDGESAALKFKEIRPHHSGRYTCVAKNSAGEARTSSRITVIGEEEYARRTAGEAPKFKKDLTDLSVIDGQTVVLEVEVIEGAEPIEVTWYHDTCELRDTPAFHYVEKERINQLVIADIFPEDAGTYMCLASNRYGSTETSCNITIKEQTSEAKPPMIEELPSEVDVDEGGIVQITAKLRGHPEPRVEWSLRGEPISPGERYQLFNVGKTHTLTIRNVRRSDAGAYKVTAENSAGTCTGTVRCIVAESSELQSGASEISKTEQCPATFTSPPKPVKAKFGTPAAFECVFTGNPTPVAVWYKQGKRIDSSAAFHITSTAETSTLRIRRVDKSHAGEYEVSIRNAFGEDLASAKLNVACASRP